MGRGRQKAKQTKVARELKYSSHSIDLDGLQRELSGGGGFGAPDRRSGSFNGDTDTDELSDSDADADYSGYRGYDDEGPTRRAAAGGR